jgi:hypothetical protein
LQLVLALFLLYLAGSVLLLIKMKQPYRFRGQTQHLTRVALQLMVIFKSKIADVLTVYKVGLHFDWMESNAFAGPDLSDNPEIISGYGSHSFGPIAIHIPEDATVGTHNYFIGIDGLEGDSAGFSWDSPTQTLQIQNYETLVYNTLLTQVVDNITAADSSTYQSPEAQSVLEQAKNE